MKLKLTKIIFNSNNNNNNNLEEEEEDINQEINSENNNFNSINSININKSIDNDNDNNNNNNNNNLHQKISKQKSEILKLTSINEELIKLNNNNNNNNNNLFIDNNSLIKNISSNLDEKIIANFQAEKEENLQKINKLKLQIEALENINTIETQNENENENIKNETHKRNPSDGLNGNNEKNQNEIRERERKIEYLLQILEEKNKIIENFKEKNDQNNLNTSNQSGEIKEQIEFLQFSNENLILMQNGQILPVILYTGLSIFLGFTAVYLGYISSNLV